MKTSTNALRIVGKEIATTLAQTLPDHSAVHVPWAST